MGFFLRFALLGLVFSTGPVLAQTDTIDFEEAISRLAAERERALTCARLQVGQDLGLLLLRQHHDEAAPQPVRLGLGVAVRPLAAVDGAVVTVLLEAARMKSAVAAREAFCRQAEPLIPTTGGEKSIFVDPVGRARPKLIEAVEEIYLGPQVEDRLARLTIRNQLEATTCSAFAEIQASS